MSLIQISTEMHIDTAICKPCGGICCKMQPGITAPAQWGTTQEERTENLKQAFATGQWAVDWWEGDTDSDGDLEQIYFVRPAAIGVNYLFHGAGRDRACTFLSADGCTLAAEARPDVCLQLIPSTGKSCDPPGPFEHENLKGEYAHLWRLHQVEIISAAQAAGHDPVDREEDKVYYSLSDHPALTGAVRRASLDLTRALAKLRRYGG